MISALDGIAVRPVTLTRSMIKEDLYRLLWIKGIPRQHLNPALRNEPSFTRTEAQAKGAQSNSRRAAERRAKLAPEVLALNRAGKSTRSISVRMHISQSTVLRILRDQEDQDSIVRQTNGSTQKAKDAAERHRAMVPEIHAMRAQGMTIKKIRDHFKIGNDAIDKILAERAE